MSSSKDEVDCANIIMKMIAAPEQEYAIRSAERKRWLRDHIYQTPLSQAFYISGIIE